MNINKFTSSDTIELAVIPNDINDDGEDVTSNAIDITEDIEISPNDLPKRGQALVVGTIYKAQYLPSIVESNSEIFYKVLYCEETNKISNKFSCKTPIFTSSKVNYSNNPSFPNNEIFKLEVDISNTMIITGSIIVNFYKSILNGSNELVGQCEISLNSIVNTGEVQYYLPQTDARSIVGTFPLSSKLNDSMNATLRIQIIWRSLLPIPQDQEKFKINPNADVISINKSNASRSNSAKSLSNSSRPSSVQSRSNRTQSTSVKIGSTDGVRKIASARVRKTMNDQRKIDRENKIMSNKLASLATAKSKDNTSSKKPYSDPVTVPKKINVLEQKNNESDEELKKILEDLKLQVKEKNNENILLKGQYNKLIIQSKRKEIAIEKFSKLSSSIPLSSSISTTDSNNADNVNTFDSRDSVLSDYNLSENEIVDKEILDIVDEYIILRKIRQDLLNRIDSSINNMKSVNEQVNDQQNNLILLKKKYSILCPTVYPPFDDSKTMISDNEINLFQQYIDELTQYNIMKELYLEGFSNDNNNDNLINDNNCELLELDTILTCLEDRKYQLENDINSLQYQLDSYKEQNLQLNDNDMIDILRTNIKYIKNIEIKLESEKRIHDLINNTISAD